MTIIVDIADNTNKIGDQEQDELIKLINYVLREEQVQGNYELSLSFVSNEEIQELNNEYRGKNVPTDVLSFPLEDDFDLSQLDPEIPDHLGDIIISLAKAEEQARDYGHSFEREVAFLTVHGILHLLGYDHETSEDEEVMFSRQKDLLNSYGITR